MWTEIENKKRELDRMRPLSCGSIKVLDDWYDVELTYSSNAIEGNTLTASETALILDKGITVGGKTLNEHYEAVDHFNAVKFIREIATNLETLTEKNILKLHELVLKQSNPDNAGIYSNVQRRILGSPVVFPAPHKIPYHMEEFADWLCKQDNTPQAASDAHYKLVSIHPFSDGNGRTARLLMNLILFRGGYPPISIRPEHRKDYINALEHRQLTDDATPFEELLAARLNDSLDTYLDSCAKELEARPERDNQP